MSILAFIGGVVIGVVVVLGAIAYLLKDFKVFR